MNLKVKRSSASLAEETKIFPVEATGARF